MSNVVFIEMAITGSDFLIIAALYNLCFWCLYKMNNNKNKLVSIIIRTKTIFNSLIIQFIFNVMNMDFKSFASILTGMSLIGLSIGFNLGYYFHGQSQTYLWMYLSAPCLGLGSGLVIYGTLYGRNVN